MSAAPLERTIGRLTKLANITFEVIEPLLEEGERILVEGNRRKVLSGKQGDGSPMPGVKYRTGVAGRPTGRTGGRFGVPKYAPRGSGFGRKPQGDPHANGNLTTAEYKQLKGPPLAPRGEKSRVIANLETAIGQHAGTFYVAKGWREILDKNGQPFIMAHFKGARTGRGLRVKLPKRDLRGIDQIERDQWHQAVSTWAQHIIAQRGP